MEWVVTTGRTVEDAKEAALDQLGVDEHDAEFEVLEEPRTGLFGRVRGEARVRARVRPTRPRPKVERRDRRRRGSDSRGDNRSRGGGRRSRAGTAAATAEPEAAPDAEVEALVASDATPATAAGGESARPAGRRRRRGGRGRGGGARSHAAGELTDNGTGVTDAPVQEGSDMTNDASVEDQAEITSTFLSGLLDAFGYDDATVTEERIDDETIELKVEGSDLGLLIGPKGQTLQAVQELSRTVVQRQATGTHHGRVRIDVAGYRQRRKEALERFAEQVAADVLASGTQKALEPMHPADRKVVHDTINEIEGVRTTSEGDEPRRRVVIMPAAPSTSDSPDTSTAPDAEES